MELRIPLRIRSEIGRAQMKNGFVKYLKNFDICVYLILFECLVNQSFRDALFSRFVGIRPNGIVGVSNSNYCMESRDGRKVHMCGTPTPSSPE